MKTYNWRKNFTAFLTLQERKIRAKLAFKTKELSWIETHYPVIVLVNVHSSFHEDVGGDLKMSALMSTIRSHTKGKVTVLMSDRAHLQTVSLDYHGNVDVAFEKCLLEFGILVSGLWRV